MDDLNLTIERTFDAPDRDRLRRLDEPRGRQALVAGREHWETAEAEVDARVGGRIHVTMHNPDKDENYGGGGVYTEVDRPNRLAFTWTWDEETRKTLIQMDFREVAGGTTVSFSHSNLLDMETVISHRGGWNGVSTTSASTSPARPRPGPQRLLTPPSTGITAPVT